MLSERLLWAITGAGFGLIFGSAINALIWRLKVGKSWVKGRSECPDCGHRLAAKDLVPVLSWLTLGGKCRYCHKPIKDHPIIEIITGMLFGLSVYAFLPNSAQAVVGLAWWLVMLFMLITLAVYDAKWMLLPDKVMGPLAVVALLYIGYLALMGGGWHLVMTSLAAATLAGGSFLLLALATRGRAMGGGDVKLAFVMGLILGLKATVLAMLVAFNVAAVVGISLIITKRRTRRDQIPFGPFLVLGTVMAFIWGRPIINWYLVVNGLGPL